MSASEPFYLFVYGTLRSDCGAAQAGLIQQHFTLVGTGTVQGELYEIDGYPGLVLSTNSNHAVTGELYRLQGPASVLEQLDEYEGCTPEQPRPHEYCRREIPVKVRDKGNVIAWVYLYNWPLNHRKKLNHGDYAQACSDGGPN